MRYWIQGYSFRQRICILMSLFWKDSLTQSSGSNADSFRQGEPLAQVSYCLSIVETHGIFQYSTSNFRISNGKHCRPQRHNLKIVFFFFSKNKTKQKGLCNEKSQIKKLIYFTSPQPLLINLSGILLHVKLQAHRCKPYMLM